MFEIKYRKMLKIYEIKEKFNHKNSFFEFFCVKCYSDHGFAGDRKNVKIFLRKVRTS